MGLFYWSHSEVIRKFIAFKAHVEKQSMKQVKVLYTSIGRKYVNTGLEDFCAIKRIDLNTCFPTIKNRMVLQKERI